MNQGDDQDPAEVDQYTEQSAQLLAHASIELINGIRDYTTEALSMSGTPQDVDALLERNLVLEDLVFAFNERVLDHTGTIPLNLTLFLDEVAAPDRRA